MKKTLAILLALAMVFSTVTVAFAEGSISADAQACVTLGMLKGDGNGVTADYTATAPKRIQAAMLFLRLKGLEKAALEFTGTDNFADADQAAWAKPVMAYLKANPTLGFQGVGNNNFDPNGAMTASSYYKVVLTALGYKQSETGVVGDFEWADVLKFAGDKGLSKIAAVTNFTVNDLAIATIEGLKATVKGSTVTLAAQLIEAKAITEAAAVAAGVYTPVPATLAVESVKAINLKETVVTFNKEVDEDSAEEKANYLLDDEDIVGTVALNADKKSVTITWTTDLANQTEFDLTVADVLDKDGKALDEVTVTFLANDVTLPVAESIKLVGPNKFKVIFSEPVNAVDPDNFAVSDKDFDYEVADVTVDSNEVTVELSDDSLEAGNYSVEVSGVTDFADLKALKKTFTLAYAKDTTAPVAKVTKSSETLVTVEFNKPVYKGDADEKAPLDAGFFYHSYKDYKPALVYTTDFETYKIYFTSDAADTFFNSLATADSAGFAVDTDIYRPLPEGNVKFVVLSEDKDENAITDEWGNEAKDDAIIALNIAPDTTAPTVTKVEVDDQTTLNVYFSEDVKVEAGNFTVVNKDGDEEDFTVTYDPDDFYATLSFESPLEGDYTLTVEDVVDNGPLEGNEIVKVEKKFTVADETAPTMTTAEGVTVIGVDKEDAIASGKETKSTDVDYIYVTFPEDMATTGTYSVLNKDNYQILNASGDLVDLKSADKIVTFGGNDRVKITIDNSSLYDVANGSIWIVIGRVADALGNVVKGNDVNNSFLVDKEDMPKIMAVKTLTTKTVEIKISGELKAVNKSFIKVNNDVNATATALYSISAWKLDKGNTVITGVLPQAEYLHNSSDKALTVELTSGDLATLAGTKVVGDSFSATADGIAPSVVKGGIATSDIAGFEFTITFDEELAATNETLYAHDIVVKNSDGDILTAGVDYSTALDLASADIIVVTIADTADTVAGDYKVYSNDTIKYITDKAGNKAKAFTTVKTLYDLVPEK